MVLLTLPSGQCSGLHWPCADIQTLASLIFYGMPYEFLQLPSYLYKPLKTRLLCVLHLTAGALVKLLSSSVCNCPTEELCNMSCVSCFQSTCLIWMPCLTFVSCLTCMSCFCSTCLTCVLSLQEITHLSVIFICEFCLKYLKSKKCLERHLVSASLLYTSLFGVTFGEWISVVYQSVWSDIW